MNEYAPKAELQDEDDVFLKKIESSMLTEMTLKGIQISEGANLLAVMCHEDVDATRMTSNHLVEVIEILGIETVRKALLDELQVVMYSNGSYVSYHHFV
ncbi:hypothetical protein Nepgr_008426 [Nepenthes gracilis]|uniref:DNA-directed RNA polymerase n=1 Tax=Nepenthes gracilis TaxID=150966 RepID=A0AAD3XJF3_NEPGR|nr:hypothetical protein Nepgr_008426 [Nepenthes gracilis]